MAPSEVEFVRDGDVVLLEHVNTQRNVHSHNEKAPITTRHWQVTAYGADGVGDSNDFWRVQIVSGGAAPTSEGLGGGGGGGADEEGRADRKRVRVLSTVMRLVHYNLGCQLHSHSTQLPKWGFEQLEVTCNPDAADSNNLWNVELHRNDRLPPGSAYEQRTSFLSNVWELHQSMMQVNNALKPKENEVTSRPWQWPINRNGQRFTGWEDGKQRVLLIGNPLVWGGALGGLLLLAAYTGYHLLRQQRGYRDPPWIRQRKERVLGGCGWLALGYLLHYLPFFAMGRVLYFHHYFPSLAFACMNLAAFVDYLIFVLESRSRAAAFGVLVMLFTALLTSFVFFAPLAYGMGGKISSYQYLNFLNFKWMLK